MNLSSVLIVIDESWTKDSMDDSCMQRVEMRSTLPFFNIPGRNVVLNKFFKNVMLLYKRDIAEES